MIRKPTTKIEGMKIAIFNGFTFHYEMFGYIIYYCKYKGYELTVFKPNRNDQDQGYIGFYNQHYGSYRVTYKDIGLFENEKHVFDAIFLVTDDDPHFDTGNRIINEKTICIDHSYRIRSPIFSKRIAVRPFAAGYYRDWALPMYPILDISQKMQKKHASSDEIHITLLGDSVMPYHVGILNRIEKPKKIVIHAISRFMSPDKFNGIRSDIALHVYRNISTDELFSIMYTSDYCITDLTESKNYVDEVMSGSIPLAFSTLTPLILSKQSNSYYRFKNVIEYDKCTDEDIHLHEIDMNLLEQEREDFIQKNHRLFDAFLLPLSEPLSLP